MQAIIMNQYGSPDVLHLQDIATPTPKDHEVLVRIYAAGVNAADWHILRAEPFLARLQFGLFKPSIQILGGDFAGVVAAVGAGVTQFKAGDAVFGDLSNRGMGAYAEYVAVPESELVRKLPRLTFAQAAALPISGTTAVQGIRDKGQVQAGQRVLIHGASGGVGTFAVQIAKAMGAEVTAVCSTAKIDQMRELGADHVIDYTRQDFAASGKTYDVILAANGDRSIFDYKRALTPTGRYVMMGGSNKQLFQGLILGPLLSLGSAQTLGPLMCVANVNDLAFLNTLIDAGKVMPVMDRTYPLAEMPDALRYVEAGHAKGKVIVTMHPDAHLTGSA